MVCPYDLSRPGGVQGQARGLAEALRRLGHEVLVVAPDDRPPGWATGHVYVAGRAIAVRANGSVAPVALSPRSAARAVRAVGEWGADVVHLHEPLAPVLGYGFLLSRRWPLVATFHRSGTGRGYRTGGLAGAAARWARQRIDVACTVSEAARETAAGVGGGSYEVLFNGVDLERFGPPATSAAGVDRRPGTGSEDPPAVLFLGRHEPRKGLGVLLDAFSRLQRPAVLWIAGDGPETDALRARHPESSRVRWLGVVGDDEVTARLGRAAVLCAPSLGGESFGMIVVEAMASGCPVIASDIDGYREAAGGHAVLVPPGDAVELCRALERVLSDPPGLPARAAAAAQAAGWSMAALAERYALLYDRAIRVRGAA